MCKVKGQRSNEKLLKGVKVNVILKSLGVKGQFIIINPPGMRSRSRVKIIII